MKTDKEPDDCNVIKFLHKILIALVIVVLVWMVLQNNPSSFSVSGDFKNQTFIVDCQFKTVTTESFIPDPQ